jgi:Fic family protein
MSTEKFINYVDIYNWMAYTEIQKKSKKSYFYLAHSVRIGSGYKKLRVFLGVDLSKSQLEDAIKKKEALLNDKISIVQKAEKDEFRLKIDFSKKFFKKDQIETIEKIKKKYKGKISLTDKDILRKIRESFLIKYTFNTNAAEGNTITLKETELILTKGIIPKSHSLREVHEIENTVKAYEYIEKYDGKLDHKFILELHKLVTENTLGNVKNEGKYRSRGQDVAMLGSKFYPPKGGRRIKKYVDELISKYNGCALSKVEAAVIFHSAFIAIHPFIDGNGRVSRLLFNWMLMNDNLPAIDFPSENHIEYTDLMETSRQEDMIPLADYLLERIKYALYMSTKMH